MSIKALLTRILNWILTKPLTVHAINLSTSYGGYIAFENGLCIQWAFGKPFTVDSTLTQIASSGTYTSSGTVALDYPILATINKSMMVGQSRYSTGHRVGFGYNGMNNTTDARIMVYDYYARPNDSKWLAQYILIGLWK